MLVHGYLVHVFWFVVVWLCQVSSNFKKLGYPDKTNFFWLWFPKKQNSSAINCRSTLLFGIKGDLDFGFTKLIHLHSFDMAFNSIVISEKDGLFV